MATPKVAMQHTTGPWRIQEECWQPENHSYNLRIESESEPESLGTAGARKIAEIPRSLGIETSVANARLIAAAPELYDALRNLLDRIDVYFKAEDECAPDWVASEQARAALTKARGEGTPCA